MESSQAQRRLVKSPPELWAELSDEPSLARRLAGFGEVRITRVDPENTVAWEGDRASGTVEIEAAGWGTKVVLTAVATAEPGGGARAEPEAEAAEAEPAAADAEPRAEAGAVATDPVLMAVAGGLAVRRRPWFFARRLGRRADAALDADRTVAILTEVLDDLGAAHRRPFSTD